MRVLHEKNLKLTEHGDIKFSPNLIFVYFFLRNLGKKKLEKRNIKLAMALLRRDKIILSFPVNRPTHGKNPRPKKFSGRFQ